MSSENELPIVNTEERQGHGQHESTVVEENRLLRQRMVGMLQEWSNGRQPPQAIPSFSDITPIEHANTQASLSMSEDRVYLSGFAHGLGDYTNLPNITETSTSRFPRVQIRTDIQGIATAPPVYTFSQPNPMVVTTTVPVDMIPQPTMVQRQNHGSQFVTRQDQYYPSDFTFMGPDPHHSISQFNSLIDIERPAKNAEHEDMAGKLKSLEQAMKNLQGLGGYKSVSFRDLCMFPDVHLPLGFKVPKFDKYDGQGDPMAHLKRYCNQLRGAGGKQELLMVYFGESLTGLASEWFIDQDFTKWRIWDDMAQDFVQQFQYNIDLVLDKKSLINLKKKTTENFREFAIRWREQAARVRPPLKESEVVETFIQTQDEEYYQHMLPALGKSFVEAIKMGEMIEDGIRTGRIVSFSTFKSTTHASESQSKNLGIERDGNSDVAMIRSGQGQAPRGRHRQYTQHQRRSPNYTQWRAATPQNPHPSPQNFQASYNPHSRQEYGKRQRPRDNFTPIGESYTSLFQKLRHLGLITPLLGYTPDPHSKSFDPTVRCAYHSDIQGHSTEDCRTLKREIERMIQEKLIVLQDSDTPSVAENSLMAWDDARFVAMSALAKGTQNLFVEDNVFDIGEGSSSADMQLSG
ncbi:uncharacterized protein LOC132616669 isoform X2 [Lycium barbarum]|nr:uncharacterized protein LOC132616669 isoform X2 [Lycium barbarum]